MRHEFIQTCARVGSWKLLYYTSPSQLTAFWGPKMMGRMEKLTPLKNIVPFLVKFLGYNLFFFRGIHTPTLRRFLLPSLKAIVSITSISSPAAT